MADMVVRANMGDTLKVEHANGDYTLIVFMEGTDAVADSHAGPFMASPSPRCRGGRAVTPPREKVDYRRDDFCAICDERRPLLMPVRVHAMYGEPDGDTLHLCLACRTGWRDDHYACLRDTWRHLPAVIRDRGYAHA